jgi:hypothetical protein
MHDVVVVRVGNGLGELQLSAPLPAFAVVGVAMVPAAGPDNFVQP